MKEKNTYEGHTSASDEELLGQRRESNGVLSKIWKFLKSILQKLLAPSNFHLDEMITIFRPFIYVCLIHKYGRKSSYPLKISFILDLIAMVTSVHRLIKNSSDDSPKQRKLRKMEKRTLMRRIWYSMLKYLIREPIYSKYTQPFLVRLFSALRISPRIYGIILSIVAYFQYYAYIA